MIRLWDIHSAIDSAFNLTIFSKKDGGCRQAQKRIYTRGGFIDSFKEQQKAYSDIKRKRN